MAIFEGVVKTIRFRNEENGWTVAMMLLNDGDEMDIVGIMPFIVEGERLRVTGELKEHPSYGWQIQEEYYESVRPETKEDILTYLEAGMIKGIGKKSAKKFVKAFGTELFQVIENEPERLCEIEGIGKKKAQEICESYQQDKDKQYIMTFLLRYGISATYANRIRNTFGNNTINVLKTNPYRLADEVDGIGFKKADSIALSMDYDRESPRRIESGIQYVLTDAASSAGHVFLPYDELLENACRLLETSRELTEGRLREMLLERRLTQSVVDETVAVYKNGMYEAEKETAMLLGHLLSRDVKQFYTEDDVQRLIDAYQEEQDVELCEEQRSGVVKAVTGSVTIITGGPGTGKTTGIRCIIDIMSRQGEVQLCAPTGRAAKRMSEATGCPAQTIHRLLEYSGQTRQFTRNADKPLDGKMVIVDEVSMVDIFLMRSLLCAIRPGMRLVLVGDSDQLPSVGAGNVLKDMIASGVVPVVRLTQVFRQAGESMIIQNAHRINHGEYPLLNGKKTDFFFERKDSPSAAAQSIVQLVMTRLPNYMGFDRIRDIQVLSPTKKTDLGVIALNAVLQNVLNPKTPGKPEVSRGDTVFRLGDKVMQIRNDYDIEWTRDDEDGVGVFNGDMGFITAIDRQKDGTDITVTFDDDRVAVYSSDMLIELELAYCISVHKSQGSEFPVVVMPMWNFPPLLMTRNLLYTAVTRAKKLVVIVGSENGIRRMTDNNYISKRYTALTQRLTEAVELHGN